MKNPREFFEQLLMTPSATGFEQPVQRVVKEYVKSFAEKVETDFHGNLMVAINTKAKRRVMLAGHCDQIGFMVRHVTKEGFIYVSKLGGIDLGVAYGAQVTIHTKKGPVDGVIGRKPIHLQSSDERDKIKLDLEKVWIDIGAKSKKEVEKKVTLGDSVTYKLNVLNLPNNLVVSPGVDNKSGLFVAIEALRLSLKEKLSVALYAVSSVQEEVGLRGATTSAFGIDPEVGIAIDVTHASDNPGNDNSKAPPIKLGKGPAICRGPNVNTVVEDLLNKAAKKRKIPTQIDPESRPLGNDANAMQLCRAGVATASLGIPNRYMHTQVEMCNFNDLELCAKLLAAFVASINDKTDFRPV